MVETFKKYSRIERLGDISLVISRTDQLVDPGSYPPQGKCVGLFFDTFRPEKALVLGIGSGSVTVRTNLPGFDLNRLITEMKVRFPYAQIEGGGHKVAGTLHFVEAAEAEVVEYIKSHLRS